MRRVSILLRRLRAILLRPKLELEMETELASHLQDEINELVSRGMTAADAEKQARETMGSLSRIGEECRDARGVNAWEHLLQDVRFSVRLLLNRKLFSTLAISTMALGVGSVTALYSIVDAALLRPLAFHQPERLIKVDGIGMRGPFDVLRARGRMAEYAAWQGIRSFNLSVPGGGLPERVRGAEVSANFFGVLGTAAKLGRTFETGEDGHSGPRIVLLSESLWRNRYGGSPDVLGKLIVLDEAAYKVVGVVPRSFGFPSSEVLLWTPMRLNPADVGAYWGSGGTEIIGRMQRAGTLASARAEVVTLVPVVRRMFPWRMPDLWGTGLIVQDLREAMVSGIRLRSWTLLGLVGILMLIATGNVANLLIGQSASRAHELTMRVSLGATGSRLARQLITEALVLTLGGALAGIPLAFLELNALRSLLPADTPRLAEANIDARVLLFTLAISLVSGLLIGLWPARKALRRQSMQAGEATRYATTGIRSSRIAATLVIAETAFATILLVACGLFLRSLWTLVHVDTGFQVAGVMTAELNPGPSASQNSDRRRALIENVRSRVLRYPGIRQVAAMNALPLSREFSTFAAAIEDHPVPPGDPAFVLWNNVVTPEHRDLLGVPLLRGRGFAASDGPASELVVLVSRSTAERFWPGQSPLGHRLKPVWDEKWRTIVGVVGDVKSYSLSGPPEWVSGEIYMPMTQALAQDGPIYLIAQLKGSPEPFLQSLTAMVKEGCPTCALSHVQPMREVIAQAVQSPRSFALLVAIFAGLALLLGAVGVYGVVSHSVLRRTRELGVRLAMGASRPQIALLVLRSSLRSVLIGVVCGIVLSWSLTRFVESLLFGIPKHDTLSFTLGPAVLVITALFASLDPALRAIRLDLTQSLREN